MSYTIQLTPGNLRSLAWAEARGYFPEDWIERLEDTDEPNVFKVPEYVAWDLRDFEDTDPDAFLSCMPPDVVSVIMELLEEIV